MTTRHRHAIIIADSSADCNRSGLRASALRTRSTPPLRYSTANGWLTTGGCGMLASDLRTMTSSNCSDGTTNEISGIPPNPGSVPNEENPLG